MVSGDICDMISMFIHGRFFYCFGLVCIGLLRHRQFTQPLQIMSQAHFGIGSNYFKEFNSFHLNDLGEKIILPPWDFKIVICLLNLSYLIFFSVLTFNNTLRLCCSKTVSRFFTQPRWKKEYGV